ncbi:esterase/lipase family protein [Legionella waltersii]|uniref:Putative lipase n=1 Tax=Legionella waltersii TaxID=66969 RepID=A0A0W1AAE0_9GAMM|nr:putative lipase [Legionella waltersii]SNV08775.1 putative lipase [Legionella waltersii]
MLKRAIDAAKENQPISTTGMFAHTYYWLTSPSGDQSYQNPSSQKDQKKELETAVYFIHGTADQPAAFQRIARRMIRAGLPNEISSLNLIAFDQRYKGKNIEFFAEELGKKIVGNKHQRVILIAHSRGGLVAAHFAEYLAKTLGIEVICIVTIGTPFNGSYLAMKPLSLFSDSVKEMEIGSEFLETLKQKIVENPASKYYFVVATEDSVVPGKSGYIEDYVKNNPNSLIELDRHGHLSIMSSHRLVALIVDWVHHYFNSIPKQSDAVIISKVSELTIIEDYTPKT